jgi:hypothetical protein
MLSGEYENEVNAGLAALTKEFVYKVVASKYRPELKRILP